MVATALAKAPADRYPTARQFAEALGPEALTPRRALGGEVCAGSSVAVPAAAAGHLPGFPDGARSSPCCCSGSRSAAGFCSPGGLAIREEDDEGRQESRGAALRESRSADQDYFVDGITDEIRGRLTDLPAYV